VQVAEELHVGLRIYYDLRDAGRVTEQQKVDFAELPETMHPSGDSNSFSNLLLQFSRKYSFHVFDVVELRQASGTRG
jgi:hypothetical protein